MSFLEKIYDKSPIFFQNIMVSVSGIQKYRERYGKIYYEHLAFLKEFDLMSEKQKKEFQLRKLIDFIIFAYENSSFYRELYKKVDVYNIKTFEDIKHLPIVDKEMIRKNIDRIITFDKKGAPQGHTGGTTGKSLAVYYTLEDSMKRMAMLDHFKQRVGFFHLKMKRATFNGKHIVPPHQRKHVYWRYNVACKQMIYSTFHISENNMKYYVESLNNFKPAAIDGFFMAMCDLANYIERNKIELKFQPVAIFPTSETITESGRELLERVFKCKVYDQYASSEGAPFVTECQHQQLHMELSSGYFEYLSEESNEILVTSFTTHGTPLIRYRIGDSMDFDPNVDDVNCKCGLKSPKVNKIEGRKLDFLYTAEGAKINAGNVANLFKNVPNAIIRAQVIQNKIDEVEILLEVDKKLYNSDYDTLLIDEFVHKFGRNTKINISHVEEIPREKSGKFRLVKNNISDIYISNYIEGDR